MNEKRFHYVYSAPTEGERKEIDDIRKRYVQRQKPVESKLQRLRRLDALVQNISNCVGIIVGVLGCLTFGLGLSMILVWSLWIGGIAVATVGGIGMGIAYPLYRKVLRESKKRYGEEIVRLSDELLADNK